MKDYTVIKNFEKISKIPRCSKKEKQISDYLKAWAIDRNLKVIQDEYLNILIYKGASEGMEEKPIVILQGHMDMVCEKNKGTVHDFDKDPIELVYKGDQLYANQTTLGADNGIAVAMMMSILEDDSLVHPPLEIVITSDEESGMTGAANVDPSLLKGKMMINLDSEDEGVLTAGCAGGGRVVYSKSLICEEKTMTQKMTLSVKGLKGGHSGVEIHLDRGNGIKILGRVLNEILEYIEVSSIEGGSADNAIPREAYVDFYTNEPEIIKEKINTLQDLLSKEYAFTDAGITLLLNDEESQEDKVISKKQIHELLDLLMLVPYGPLKQNPEIALVILSNNPGVLKIQQGSLKLICAPRSSIQSALDYLMKMMERIGMLTNFQVEKKGFYPGWEFAKESYLRTLCNQVYEKKYYQPLVIEAIHAGLECGFFASKIPGLDAVSIGPSMEDIHTPNENINLPSVKRTYEYLIDVLAAIE